MFRPLICDEYAKIQVCNEIPALKAYLDVCIRALYKCARKKLKYNISTNNSPFMNKKISIIDRTRLRNKLLKNQSPEMLISLV